MDRYRKFFPICDEMVFFNNAGVAPISTRVVGAVEGYLELLASRAGSRYDLFEEHQENLRRQAARLIGCKVPEVAFVKNTSHGISLIASGLRWREGDIVLVPVCEFPANVYPWLALERRGVKVQFIPAIEGRVTVAEIEKLLSPRVRLIAASSVEFSTGYRVDLDAIGELCERNGIYFFVDAIQSLGVLPLDVRRSKIDFLAADAHKWLLCPEGIGLFYCSDEILDEIDPVLIGWHSVLFHQDYDNYDYTLKRTAQKFEEGSANMMGTFALESALELLFEVGLPEIEAQVMHLTDVIITGLNALDVAIVSPLGPKERSGIVAFRPRAGLEEIFAGLTARKVICAKRGGGLRVSPHFYNNTDDVDKFFLELEALVAQYR